MRALFAPPARNAAERDRLGWLPSAAIPCHGNVHQLQSRARTLGHPDLRVPDELKLLFSASNPGASTVPTPVPRLCISQDSDGAATTRSRMAQP
jgi:hypothetical protein